MKKMLLAVMVLVVFATVSFGQDHKYVAGADAAVLIGKVKMVDGGVKSVIGISPLLGIGYKSYFTPLKQDSYSLYWNAGTDLVLLPFLGIGADYRIKAGSLPLYAGVNVTSRLVTIIPIPIPSVNVGIYF